MGLRLTFLRNDLGVRQVTAPDLGRALQHGLFILLQLSLNAPSSAGI